MLHNQTEIAQVSKISLMDQNKPYGEVILQSSSLRLGL